MIRAALRRPVTAGGVTYEVGTALSMVSSALYTWVTVPAGTEKLLPNNSLRWACVVPGCGQEATYVAPDYWCRGHWTEWNDSPMDDEGEFDDKPWMTDQGREHPAPVVTTLAWNPGEPEAGTVVKAGEERLLIVVRVEGEQIRVDRLDLAIECERDGCTEEAGNWDPAYWCRLHYMEWLDGDYVHGGRRCGDPERGWNKGLGAARPTGYPELSPREKWVVDRDLGLLDWGGPAG